MHAEIFLVFNDGQDVSSDPVWSGEVTSLWQQPTLSDEEIDHIRQAITLHQGDHPIETIGALIEAEQEGCAWKYWLPE